MSICFKRTGENGQKRTKTITNRQFPDDEIRSVGDKPKETKDRMKEGTLKVDHGTDAMIVVLGKEKGCYTRGVGSRVTYKRYFDLPRSRQASDKTVAFLQSQLDNERRKHINPIDNSANEAGKTPLSVVGCENDVSIQKSNGLATLEKEIETRVNIFSKSVINRTASECNVASDNDIFTESSFLQKERGSELNRQQQEGSSTFVSANVGTSSYTHNCSPFGHSDEPAANQTKQRRTASVHASSTHRHSTTSGPPVDYVYLGDCDQIFQHCRVLLWYEKRIKSYSRSSPWYHQCCISGRVVLRPKQECPAYIKELFSKKHLLENVRAYNQMFSVSSLGAKTDDSINNGKGPYVFKFELSSFMKKKATSKT
uniref:Helitron helicase-like domain-containing protein n=1 Tax=Tanacetum cinerariifolium TaxID=118510 RepID=A0A6L2M3B0_TANCI|nr:helitron helicase-like domain-containing protein [Tanacetum cinerariifolium]